jgi:hypothetical protein
MAKYTITAPIPKSFTGYGLNFVEGVATTEEKRIADYLKTKGYKVKKEKDEEAPPATPSAPPATPSGNPDIDK